jgi:hypothetical protein
MLRSEDLEPTLFLKIRGGRTCPSLDARVVHIVRASSMHGEENIQGIL